MMNFEELNIETLKEGNHFEAKLAKGGIPNSLWETYSSFANTDGGIILLGVKENKDHTFMIEDIEKPEQMVKTFWDNINNKKIVNINILSNMKLRKLEENILSVLQFHVQNEFIALFSKEQICLQEHIEEMEKGIIFVPKKKSLPFLGMLDKLPRIIKLLLK